MKKERWVVSAKRADFQAIADRFGIDPVIARLIRNRDVTGEKEIEEYLFGDLEQLHDPLLMKDMERAADLIAEKIREKKPIRIIGDYDIDGVTATYILLTGLKDLGADVDVRIPDRIADGYGLNEHLVQFAADEGAGHDRHLRQRHRGEQSDPSGKRARHDGCRDGPPRGSV